MMVAIVLVTVGMQLVSNANKQSRQQELYVNEAKNAALAGLQDAKGWFIRQASQPVSAASGFGAEPNPVPTFSVNPTQTPAVSLFKFTYVDQAFNPTYNAANPMLGDTMNATIAGIVNEFSPQGAGSVSEGGSGDVIWDRYEVRQQSAGATDPNAVHDISGERVNNTFNGSGLAWYLVSTGYVYKRMDFQKINSGTDWKIPYNQSPNILLGTSKMATEIRKLSVQNPFPLGSPGGGVKGAAIYTKFINQVNIASGPGNEVSGYKNPPYVGCAGITVTGACPNPTGYTTVNFPDGTYCAPATLANELTDSYVFGMSVTSLAALADFQGSAGPNTQVVDINGTQDKLTYYQGNLTYDPASAVTQYQALDASGILVVNGNLTLTSGYNTAGTTFITQIYDGVIFVTGNLTLQGAQVDGEVIVGNTSGATTANGNVYVQTGAGNSSLITYDSDMVANVITKVASYREDISQKRLLLAVPNL